MAAIDCDAGKLPVCVARTSGQIPIYYNHANGSAWHQGDSIGFANYVDMSHTPRYVFGYGLSYTTFTYSDLKLNQKAVSPDGEIRAEITVQNTGTCAGDEVVQMYFRDPYASQTRPVKELAGFLRIHLEVAEKKTVVFTMKASQTAFLDSNMNWKVEKGEIILQIGSSSEDIRAEESFQITDNLIIKGRERAFYAKTLLL